MNVDNIENMSPCFVIEIIAVDPCCPGRVPRLPVQKLARPTATRFMRSYDVSRVLDTKLAIAARVPRESPR